MRLSQRGRIRSVCCVLLLAAGLAGGNARAATRIVTLAPHLAELVCAVGACSQLVGVSARSDYPAQVASIAQIGDAFAVNLEVILSLHPDLVLAWDGGTPPDRVARLRALGLRVELVSARKLDDVGTALQQVGSWTGTGDIATQAAHDYRTRLAALRAQWRDASPIRVAYQIETAPAYSINRDSPISEVIELCGGVNVFATLSTIAAPVSAEAMLAAAPDVVLYGGEENSRAIRAYWHRLSSSTVARNDTLYAVNADWLGRATPRLLDGVDEVCHALEDARTRLTAPSRTREGNHGGGTGSERTD